VPSYPSFAISSPNKSVLSDVNLESQQHVRTRSCTLPSYARKCKVWRVSLCVIPAALPPWYTTSTPGPPHSFQLHSILIPPIGTLPCPNLPRNEPRLLNDKPCFEPSQGGASCWPPVSHTLPPSHIPSKLDHARNFWPTAAPAPTPTLMENLRSSPTSGEHLNPAM
jgi:hypothetical protein